MLYSRRSVLMLLPTSQVLCIGSRSQSHTFQTSPVAEQLTSNFRLFLGETYGVSHCILWAVEYKREFVITNITTLVAVICGYRPCGGAVCSAATSHLGPGLVYVLNFFNFCNIRLIPVLLLSAVTFSELERYVMHSSFAPWSRTYPVGNCKKRLRIR